METKQTLPSTNGADLPTGEIKRVFALQQAFLPHLRRTTARERAQKLVRLREALLRHRQNIRDAVYADFRKPALEADATELLTVVQEINHAVKHVADWMNPTKVSAPLALLGTSSRVLYEPKGTGLIISPWNYPFLLSLGPLVGAIAAGCTAILKPSEYTVHSTRLLKTLLAEVFDEREVAVFEGDHHMAQALLKLPFNHIYFTGSPQVGKIVMRAAAEHLASVTLELGGKSPAVIDDTADLAQATKKIAIGKFSNVGQTCIAPDYAYVHERVHDAFVEALKQEVQRFYGPDEASRAASPHFGRIISEKQHTRLTHLYEDALARGAHAVMGARSNADERYLAPTLLTQVPPEAAIMQEEIFGPILPVLPYRSLDEVVRGINGRPRPLVLYLFSQKETHIDYVLGQTTAGTSCVNETLLHFLHPGLPFGGTGNSGVGKGHGYHSFLAFTNQRPVLSQQLKRAPIEHLYPPYGRKAQKLLDLLLKYF